LVLPAANAHAMNLRLREISTQVAQGAQDEMGSPLAQAPEASLISVE
jgi:hypothetical protein